MSRVTISSRQILNGLQEGWITAFRSTLTPALQDGEEVRGLDVLARNSYLFVDAARKIELTKSLQELESLNPYFVRGLGWLKVKPQVVDEVERRG